MSDILKKFEALRPTPTSQPYSKKTVNHLPSMLEIEKKILERACEDIRFSRPLLTLEGTGIIFPNTITVMQGQKGVHKSRIIENFCAAFLKNSVHIDFLGFKVEPFNSFYVVYIDTERNTKDQFPFAVQRIKKMAGYEATDMVDNLSAVSLIEIPREDRYEAIRAYLNEIRQKHADKQIVVILDVITDCVESFNDVIASSQLIDQINMMINESNVTFICVIHENPTNLGAGKARGHLGTEIINKATTSMSIGFETDKNVKNTELIVLNFLHTRNSKLPRPHYLRYCSVEKGLVLADSGFIQEQKDLKNHKATLEDMKAWLREHLMGEVPKSTLVADLMEFFDCADRTISDRLKELSEGEGAHLIRKKHGKEVFFSLNPGF